jgi:syntaxin 1B/2/3
MLREFEAGVARIGQLHAQSLSLTDPAGAAQQQALLDEHVASTRALSNDLKGRIQGLEAMRAAGPSARMQKNRTALLKKRFVEYLQRYQDVEREYRAKYRARVERQFMIGAAAALCLRRCTEPPHFTQSSRTRHRTR